MKVILGDESSTEEYEYHLNQNKGQSIIDPGFFWDECFHAKKSIGLFVDGEVILPDLKGSPKELDFALKQYRTYAPCSVVLTTNILLARSALLEELYVLRIDPDGEPFPVPVPFSQVTSKHPLELTIEEWCALFTMQT